jgi:protein-tyrosine phosphatase
MSFVDLHVHLLPGVDDGPATEADSLAHAARMAADGVVEATVTPHVGHPAFPVDVTTIAERTRALQAALDAEGIALRLVPGGELHPTAPAHLRRSELEAVAQGPPGARWVLLEVPFAGVDEAFLDACATVRGHGAGIVVAHPERAADAERGLALLRPEVERGAVLQVNACSLLGRHGDDARRTAERLIRTGAAWIVASDGHGTETRSHTLRAAYALARAAGVPTTQAWRLTSSNPRFLLHQGVPNIGRALAHA